MLQNSAFTDERVPNNISYNDYNIGETPEIITLDFAKAHPDDKKSRLIYGVRVLVDPSEYLEDVGGTYPISIMPATVDSRPFPVVVEGQVIGMYDPKADDVVVLDEINSSLIFHRILEIQRGGKVMMVGRKWAYQTYIPYLITRKL